MHPIDEQYTRTPKYIVIGVKPDGRKQRPPNYECVAEVLFSRSERDRHLFEIPYASLRIYEIPHECLLESYGPQELSAIRKKYQETAEREQYEKLKQKYEQNTGKDNEE